MSELYSLEQIAADTEQAVQELLKAAKLEAGDILVVGCSTSEVQKKMIGSASNEDIGRCIYNSIQKVIKPLGIYLAAQCCEHLNRALVLEADAAKQYGYQRVNVIPQLKAGGSFASAAYAGMEKPYVVESIQAAAGMDIGDTLIGMHLRPVAVPVRISIDHIGSAHLVLARTRPRCIGGARAVYDPALG
ncbi:MAG TPA: TIGR01440 family protein [Clostridiales bacterium]|nr:TIGR01440 family protein [Clostridiales bacterium]